MDTEFPGIVVRSTSPSGDQYVRPGDATAHYRSLKANVDLLELIQLGLALSDDFDVVNDVHAHNSVELLRRQGIDFEKNREFGIDYVRFAEPMMSSGLVSNDAVMWVTFHCAYDFGYLVKCSTGELLPDQLIKFLNLVRLFF
ncbi:hypothetical protein CRYUN_Cryun08bG0120000 [Craigia yunnanensis]